MEGGLHQVLCYFLLTTTLGVVHLQQPNTRASIGNCPRPTMDELGRSDVRSPEGLVATAFPRSDGGNDPQNVRILAFTFVCESSGLTRNTLNSFSIIVRFECTGSICGSLPIMLTEQFQYDCAIAYFGHNGSFAPPNKNGNNYRTQQSAVTGTLDTTLKLKCGDCTADTIGNGLVPDSDTHCVGK